MNANKTRAWYLEKTFTALMWLFLAGACLAVIIPLAFMFTASPCRRDILKMPYPWIPDGIYCRTFKCSAGPEGTFIFAQCI